MRKEPTAYQFQDHVAGEPDAEQLPCRPVPVALGDRVDPVVLDGEHPVARGLRRSVGGFDGHHVRSSLARPGLTFLRILGFELHPCQYGARSLDRARPVLTGPEWTPRILGAHLAHVDRREVTR